MFFTTYNYSFAHHSDVSINCNKNLVADGYSFFEVTEKRGSGKIYAYTDGVCFKPNHLEKSRGKFKQISKDAFCQSVFKNESFKKLGFILTSLKNSTLPCN